MSSTLVAQEAKVTQLLSKALTSLPGKEGQMITVEYPPGSSNPIHRHNAYGFIYVLEGSIVMQVRGGKETTLTPTFIRGRSRFFRQCLVSVGTKVAQRRRREFALGDEATSKLKQYLELNGGQCRTRTCDLLLVRQAL